MRALRVLLLLMVVFSSTVEVYSQATVPVAQVQMTRDQFVYGGPGTNSSRLEYLSAGLVVLADGRNADSTWISVNVQGQVLGWVPAGSIRVLEGDLNNLFVRGGLLDTGKGPYTAENPALRAAELEMIRVSRITRAIGARWNRLQAFLSASCQNIPAPPAPVQINATLPELDQVVRQLTFIQEQTELAVLIYQQVCEKGGAIDPVLYQRGIGHINPAFGSYDNLRRYVDSLMGLEYVAP